MPQWMQWLATISPATYALRGIRAAILEGAGLATLWSDIWPLLVLGVVSIPLASAPDQSVETELEAVGGVMPFAAARRSAVTCSTAWANVNRRSAPQADAAARAGTPPALISASAFSEIASAPGRPRAF